MLLATMLMAVVAMLLLLSTSKSPAILYQAF